MDKMIRKTLRIIALFIGVSQTLLAQISGEKWDKTTIDFTGPMTSELAEPNPFSYYRLDVTFTHESGSPIMVIPGYYAADGKAANTSGNSGNVWRVIFSAPKVGTWQYEASFKAGEMAAVTEGGVSAGFMDGKKGTLNIREGTKKLPDNRANGRLQYVGKRYLEWSETGKPFLKVGADSPENMLHYVDFDGNLNGYGKLGKDYYQLIKTWEPHAKDFEPAAQEYTWQNGKGKNILGAINYLSGLGLNAFSFLTFSVDGDDGGVYPHIVKNDSLFISASHESKSWEKALYHDRFDCSKLDQWERVFSYADTKGMYLHFKTFENEGVSLMSKSELTNDRKMYYRELIARFGHHPALNWNLSEETRLTVDLIRKISSYIRDLDAYKNNVVQHTFPPGYPVKKSTEYPNYAHYYPNLVGFQSDLTGASLQLDVADVHTEVLKWVTLSANSGKPWVVANDEQGSANKGVAVDASSVHYKGKMSADNEDEVRHNVLWGTFMAGGAGVEYYYGYNTEQNDLNAEDHRSREVKYKQAVIAQKFFSNLPVLEMKSMDELTTSEEDYVFGNENLVVVYLPKGVKTAINLPKGTWKMKTFNPIKGGNVGGISKVGKTLSGLDNSQDWVLVLTNN
jgi:hypothetical protein